MLQKLKTIHYYRPVVIDAFRSTLAKNSSIVAKVGNTLLNVMYFLVKRMRLRMGNNPSSLLIKKQEVTLTKDEEKLYVKIWGKNENRN